MEITERYPEDLWYISGVERVYENVPYSNHHLPTIILRNLRTQELLYWYQSNSTNSFPLFFSRQGDIISGIRTKSAPKSSKGDFIAMYKQMENGKNLKLVGRVVLHDEEVITLRTPIAYGQEEILSDHYHKNLSEKISAYKNNEIFLVEERIDDLPSLFKPGETVNHIFLSKPFLPGRPEYKWYEKVDLNPHTEFRFEVGDVLVGIKTFLDPGDLKRKIAYTGSFYNMKKVGEMPIIESYREEVHAD